LYLLSSSSSSFSSFSLPIKSNSNYSSIIQLIQHHSSNNNNRNLLSTLFSHIYPIYLIDTNIFQLVWFHISLKQTKIPTIKKNYVSIFIEQNTINRTQIYLSLPITTGKRERQRQHKTSIAFLLFNDRQQLFFYIYFLINNKH